MNLQATPGTAPILVAKATEGGTVLVAKPAGDKVIQPFSVSFTAPKANYTNVGITIGNAVTGAGAAAQVSSGLGGFGGGSRTLQHPFSLSGAYTSKFSGPKDAVDAAIAALKTQLASPTLAQYVTKFETK
ncbi:MAG: hypothetical protein JWN41_210 [Thermoleophilia bacterium]|nr:hypothetical protein [Thermoleophilia bacterium]